MATSGPANDLALYLRRIGEYPLLDAHQERYLAWRIINDNDHEARQTLIQANLRLVVSECRRYAGRGLAYMDLIAEGNVGLIRAVSRFDPAIGVRFSTYAVTWIRRMLQLALLDARSLIRLPTRRLPTVGDDPSQRHTFPNVVVVRPVGHDLDPYRDVSGRHDDTTVSTDTLSAVNTTLEQLETADNRQAQILRLRLGLAGREPMSYRTIGRTLGISHERARQIGKLGLDRLRDELA